MRKIWGLWALLMMSGAVYAAPSPPPPEDFAAAQYIDGEGCVYVHNGKEWTLRLDKNGVRICGFPPTLDVRRTDPDTVSVLPSAKTIPEQAEGFEEGLLSQLAGGLRAGEFTADHHHKREKRLEPEPQGDGGMMAQVQKLSRLHEAIEVATAGGIGNSDLCQRLGYEPNPDPMPILGGDVTQGMCPGMRATIPEMRGAIKKPKPSGIRVATAGPAGSVKVEPRAEGQLGPLMIAAVPFIKPAGELPVAAMTRKPARLDVGDSATVTLASGDDTAKPVQKGEAGTAAAKIAAPPELVSQSSPRPVRKAVIPAKQARTASPEPSRRNNNNGKIAASPRYIEIGAFADHEIAAVAIRQLSRMGYPVARADQHKDDIVTRHVLAGPFDDSQALTSALKELNKIGYSGAFPR